MGVLVWVIGYLRACACVHVRVSLCECVRLSVLVCLWCARVLVCVGKFLPEYVYMCTCE